MGLEQKKPLLGPTSNFDRKCLCNGMISAIRKKLLNLLGLPYMSPNLVNFGVETAENGWRVFAYP